MKKYYNIKKLDNDSINIRISTKGYGKCYYEVSKDIRKDLLDNIKKDILLYGLSLNNDERQLINRVLTIIEQHYFK